MTTRRGFLGAMLAAAAAPALVRASSLMPLYVPPAPKIITLAEFVATLWGDGVTDDTAAIQALINGGAVMYMGQELREPRLPAAAYRISSTLVVGSRQKFVAKNSSFYAGGIASGPVLDLADGAEAQMFGCRIDCEGAPGSLGLMFRPSLHMAVPNGPHGPVQAPQETA